jgi:O-methyltransferase
MERRVVGLGPLRFFTRGIGHAPIPRTSFPLSDQMPSKGSVTNTISIVIPTFRRPEMLQSLLKSLSQGTRIPDEVVVVDNDPDASANPGPIDGLNIRVIHAGLGISLAGARNVGWRSTASDLCFFIDDDNVVEPDAVELLAEAFLNDNVGLAGPVILAGDSNTIWCAGIARSPWTGQTRCILGGEHDAPSDSIWATDDMPDAFMVRRSVLETLDGFDEENFPIHYDESDFTARVRTLGFYNGVVGGSRVRHYGWVGLSPGSAMVRAAASHGMDRVHQMALSRVRFHAMHSKGLQRVSTVGLFLPAWVALTALGCLRADASWQIRLAAARAVASGVLDGYREMLEHRANNRRRAPMEQSVSEVDWAASDGFVGTTLPPARMLLANLIKSIAFHTGLHRVLFYRYDYMFRPSELALLVSSLTETHGQKGPILEIGCAAGHTTVYLNKHLDDLGDAREYVCVDTFAGFTEEDIAVEVERGHESRRYSFVFRAYRKDWFDQTMRNNRVTRVTSIKADVNQFDFGPYEDISFCLIDVDLNRPVRTALEAVYPRMAPGGVILVDDCVASGKYDGAFEAYTEFVQGAGLPVDIREGKVGVIKIPSHSG